MTTNYAELVKRLRARLGEARALQIGDQRVSFDAAVELPVRADNLGQLYEELQGIAAQLYYFLQLQGLANAVVSKVAAEYRAWKEEITALVYSTGKTPAVKELGKLTKDAVEAVYRTDAQYAVWQERVREAEKNAATCSAIVECLRLKAQMLKEVARLTVAEAGGDLRNLAPRA